MAHGDRAPEVAVWTRRLQTELAAMRRAGGDDELDRLIDLDLTRAEARLARITESNSTLPRGLSWLMFASAVVSVLALAVFMSSKVDRRIYVSGLVVFAVLLGGTLYMINDLDSPFSGVNKLEPKELTRISRGLEKDYTAFAPGVLLPCNAEGVAN